MINAFKQGTLEEDIMGDGAGGFFGGFLFSPLPWWDLYLSPLSLDGRGAGGEGENRDNNLHIIQQINPQSTNIQIIFLTLNRPFRYLSQDWFHLR